jgi:predicted nucleic acid-binding protein
VILLDTSGLLSVIDERQRHHAACAAAVTASQGPLLLSPFVLAELDYLVATRVGAKAQIALLDEVLRGAYRLEPFSSSDVASAREVMARYPRLELGLADASIVVLAARHGVRDILTLDERRFRAVHAPDRRRFRLLPADA